MKFTITQLGLTLAVFFVGAQLVGHAGADECMKRNPELSYQACRVIYG